MVLIKESANASKNFFGNTYSTRGRSEVTIGEHNGFIGTKRGSSKDRSPLCESGLKATRLNASISRVIPDALGQYYIFGLGNGLNWRTAWSVWFLIDIFSLSEYEYYELLCGSKDPEFE